MLSCSDGTSSQGWRKTIMRWIGSFLVFWIVVALLVTTGREAYGQMLCVDRVELFDDLAAKWNEELIEVKVIEGQGLLELLASRAEGTWTVVVTRPGGTSCVLATGRGLRVGKYSLERTEYVL